MPIREYPFQYFLYGKVLIDTFSGDYLTTRWPVEAARIGRFPPLEYLSGIDSKVLTAPIPANQPPGGTQRQRVGNLR